MSLPSVGVIVVNWNGEEFLSDCLRSTFDQDYGGEVTVLLIDNGSTDGSVALVRKDFPEVRIFEDHQNNYCAANNLGVREAGTDLVLQLNTDTKMVRDTLTRLVGALESDPKAAGVAPRILYPDRRVYTTGVQETKELYWVDRDEGATEVPIRDLPEEVFGISGCCALYRRNVWEELGGLDEDYHMYYEDVDFSLRVKAAGYRLLYCSAASITHVGHGSISKTPEGKDWLGERNRLLVLASHYIYKFAGACVRSPWFQAASTEELRAFLPMLAKRHGSDTAIDLVVAMRDDKDFPELMREREDWIAKLLREVSKLRIYRLPGKRLKPAERAFLRWYESKQ